MLTALFTACVILSVISYGRSTPLFALFLSWSICLFPIIVGVISYISLEHATERYVYLISMSLSAFTIGVILANYISPSLKNFTSLHKSSAYQLTTWLPVAKIVRLIAALSIALLLLNVILGGIDLTNLSNVRQQITNIEEAGLVARLIAITNWACFFSAAFGICFFDKLEKKDAWLFVLCGLGAIMASLTSAGRQSILQILLLVLITYKITGHQRILNRMRTFYRNAIIIAGSSGLIVYVTVNRAANYTSYNRADLLLRLFGARIAYDVENFLSGFGEGFREFMVETIIYVSHTVPLFSISSEIGFPKSYGQLSFPFLARQIEPLTGGNVLEALQLKGRYIDTTNIIGVGWDTGLSSPLLDFGTFGLVLFMFIQGYFSQLSWRYARGSGNFGVALIAALFILAAAYTPFLPLFSDASMFLLLLASTGLLMFTRKDIKMTKNIVA